MSIQDARVSAITPDLEVAKNAPAAEPWQVIVKRWQVPSVVRACWQLVATLAVYIALWWGMYLSLEVSWWLTLPLAALAGAILVRLFILFHDCGHGSFFPSRVANDMVGRVLGVLTFTPYLHWRMEHAIHHATTCDLERRGVGDVWTMTVQEYLAASRGKRFLYRLARNPIVLFGVAPVVLFLFLERWPRSGARARERWSVWFTNMALVGLVLGLGSLFGFLPYLVIQLVVMGIGGTIGVWLFYLQHQFEDTYWERTEKWDYVTAALQGSSFYKLPKVLQWVTGNIGFHHIHHLNARIPNYNLERCHKAEPLFQTVRPITLFASLKAASLRLWDESSQKLVGWRHVRQLRRAAAASVSVGAGRKARG